MLELFRIAPQFIVEQRLAFGTFHGYVPRHRFAAIFGPLFHALVAGAAERGNLVAVQQRVCLRHVGDIAGRADARGGIDADAGLHTEVPVIAFLRLLHLWSWAKYMRSMPASPIGGRPGPSTFG